jgi:hypothetical protein
MSYADSLKAQYKNRISGEPMTKHGASVYKLKRLSLITETRGEGGTGSPSRHNHFSDDYHAHKGIKCWYCDRMFWMDRSVFNNRILIRTKDHIRPKSEGGINNLINNISCCQDCNMLKGRHGAKKFANKIKNNGYAQEMGDYRKLMIVRAFKIHNKRKNYI